MSHTQISSHRRQAGVTSLFIVIFSAILLSVITMSFAYLMNRELQRSSDDELSQSAYDSAMAGVEDAKRVVMLAQSGSAAAQAAIESGECNTVALAGVAGSEDDEEVMIQSTTSAGGGAELNQAYTCVTISLDSEDYEASVDQAMKSVLVPLKAVSDFDKIRIEWHATEPNTGLDHSCANPDLLAVELCRANEWGTEGSVPALLRSQLITPGDNITYSTLDSTAGGTTAFLYPKNLLSDEEMSVEMGALQRYVNAVADDLTESSASQPHIATCVATVEHAFGYRCEATLSLSDRIGEGSDLSLLRLTPIYSATSFRVTLLDDDEVVKFDGVQPVVDSTGRANDLFRRVEARLSLVSEAQYPEFAVDVEGNICKDFYVYQGGSGQSSGSCTP